MRDGLTPHGRDPKPSQVSTVDTAYGREASLEIKLISCNSRSWQQHFQASCLTGKMYLSLKLSTPGINCTSFSAWYRWGRGHVHWRTIELTALIPKSSHLLTPYLLFNPPLCTSLHFQISISPTPKGGQTNNLNPHLNKYMQGCVRLELSHKGDKCWGLLGWCGACVGILSVVTMSRDFFFSWTEENMRGSVYLKQSQLQPLCHTEIRGEEEAFI